jgi:rhomboid protease GluP
MDKNTTTEAFEEILTTDDPDLFWSGTFILTALQIHHQTSCKDNTFHIFVPESQKQRALKEIEEYFSENDNGLLETLQQQQSVISLQIASLLPICSLAIFHLVTGPWDGNSFWFQQGAGDSQAILENSQWYRLVTALTLHTDTLHLLNNCLLGGFLLHFFFHLVGSGIGFFALVLSSVAGNYINVALHGPGHLFVGFSTAIFAVIGLLSMIRYCDSPKDLSYHVFVPLMGGIALLAMLGSSGERTDLGAHFFGLVCGLIVGRVLCLQFLKMLRCLHFFQTTLFLASIFTVLASWLLALQA